MLVVGLTGGIGCGKSTVAAMLKEHGAVIIDADEIARRIVAPGLSAWRELVDEFGREILNDNGTINRKALAAKAFSDDKAAKRLNEITHPYILKEIEAQIISAANRGTNIVVLDAPLLLETPAADSVDLIIVVEAEKESCMKRLMRSGRLSYREAGERMRYQLSQAEKAGKADYIIDNNGALEETEVQVARVWAKIVEKESCRH